MNGGATAVALAPRPQRWTLWPISVRIPISMAEKTAYDGVILGDGRHGCAAFSADGEDERDPRDHARHATARIRWRGRSTAPCPDRSVRAGDHLSARVGDRPLRFSLRLLHVGEHGVPAEGRPALARRARPAVQRLHCARRAQAAAHRRRAAGAARHHDARRLALAPSLDRRARRAHADHQRLAAAEICRRARRPRRAAHQRLARYARPRQVPRHHALGRAGQGPGRHRCRAGGRAQGQDQCRCAQRRERGRVPGAASNGRTGAAWS